MSPKGGNQMDTRKYPLGVGFSVKNPPHVSEKGVCWTPPGSIECAAARNERGSGGVGRTSEPSLPLDDLVKFERACKRPEALQ